MSMAQERHVIEIDSGIRACVLLGGGGGGGDLKWSY